MEYLGVIIDHKLKWCEHMSYVKNKVSKGLDIIFKARAVLDQQCLLTLYNSFVYPYLIYCIKIWGTASQIHLQPRSPKCAAITGVGVDMSLHCIIKCPKGSASYTASGSKV